MVIENLPSTSRGLRQHCLEGGGYRENLLGSWGQLSEGPFCLKVLWFLKFLFLTGCLKLSGGPSPRFYGGKHT